MDEIRTAVVEEVDYDAERDQKFQILNKLLENRQMRSLQLILEDMNEFDVAEFLSEIDEKRRPMVFRMLSKEMAADVFANFDVDDQETIINSITDSELAGIIEELYVDDAADIVEEMPANVVKRILKQADPEMRSSINQILRYPEYSAGSIMTTEYVSLRPSMTVEEAILRIRRQGVDKETIYTCYVTDGRKKLVGVVSVKELLLSEKEALIKDIMDENVITATFCRDSGKLMSSACGCDARGDRSQYGYFKKGTVPKNSPFLGLLRLAYCRGDLRTSFPGYGTNGPMLRSEWNPALQSAGG